MPPKPRILVVDDEPQAVDLVALALRRLAEVERAGSGDEAWEKARSGHFDLVISDHRMPGMDGLELLGRIAARGIRIGRVLLTAYSEIPETITAINEGRIHAYLNKPCSPDEVRATVRSVLELVRRDDVPRSPLIGESRAIRELRARAARVAHARFPVLILGETGTGKELVARSLHEGSPRADRPFVAINCGALPESLLESELFGHVRGAFTGANADKPGLFEQANGGTLFLDEIGDTSPALQVSLLRVLETSEVRRVGDSRTRPVSVRLVSATHRDIESMVKEREFRQDLYYRINTIVLHVPPLREHREDIRTLARHFASECARAQGTPVELADDFLDALGGLDLPGNVRELRGIVERGIALAMPDSVVTAAHMQASADPVPAFPPSGIEPSGIERPDDTGFRTLRERVEEVQSAAVIEALAHFGGNRTQAARALGLSRPGLTKMMRRLGISAPGKA
ncbi:MAG: sigma-54-dependent transcriptional regulator [Myxococcota bacterium]